MNVSDYACRELDLNRTFSLTPKDAGYCKHQWDSSLFKGLSKLPIDTPCGNDCRLAIDKAKQLIDALDYLPPAYPGQDMRDAFWRDAGNAIIRTVAQTCEIYYYG